jgi:hypothetical protein
MNEEILLGMKAMPPQPTESLFAVMQDEVNP